MTATHILGHILLSISSLICCAQAIFCWLRGHDRRFWIAIGASWVFTLTHLTIILTETAHRL